MSPDPSEELVALLFGGLALVSIGWGALHFGFGVLLGGGQ